MIKIAMITNSPAPYREETYTLLNRKLKNNFHVFFCASKDPTRLWNINEGSYEKTFLKNSYFQFRRRSIHINFDIIKALNKYNPDVVITSGFFPTMLLAFIWSKLKNKKHIPLTDGTIICEKHLTVLHKTLRKFIYKYSDAFIGSSKKSLELYESYNVKKNNLFLSPLCIKNDVYKIAIKEEKTYDIIWSGQFIDLKMPYFFVNVVKLVNKVIPCKIILIGSGPLKDEVLSALSDSKINYTYPGYVQQEQLPAIYGAAKVLLFPTKHDAWGIVASEACAAGVPVITCNNAGAADELIISDFNGYVLQLDENIWAEHIINLLSDKELYKKFSNNAVRSIERYNYEYAVQVIIDAVNFTMPIKFNKN